MKERLASLIGKARAISRREGGRLKLSAELAGYGLIVVAAFDVARPLGFLAAGLALVWIGNAGEV